VCSRLDASLQTENTTAAMRTKKSRSVALVATLVVMGASLLIDVVEANAFVAGISPTFLSQAQVAPHVPSLTDIPRGGATAVDEEENDSEYDDLDSSDEEEEFDPVLAKSALTAASKTKVKALAVAKKAASATLLATAPKPSKIKSSIFKRLMVPYIIRACLNPLTVIRMTRGYWASLVNLNYLQQVRSVYHFDVGLRRDLALLFNLPIFSFYSQDSSQNLRSALEEKAKKGGASGSAKGKRKMKPGQAKTLSDLPQLNT
jgi:hypothetical protein